MRFLLADSFTGALARLPTAEAKAVKTTVVDLQIDPTGKGLSFHRIDKSKDARWGRIDILHNNVGVSIGGGDKPLDELSEEAFDRVCAINLRGTIMACKHVLPIMRLQRSGVIINISSVAARENSYPLVTYKATKAAMIAFTEQLALQNAPYGIRANCILPGLKAIGQCS